LPLPASTPEVLSSIFSARISTIKTDRGRPPHRPV
jgi:hypothetical protein